MSTNRPEFALESYDDTSLPQGTRLTNEDQLVGHTIKAVVSCPMGRLRNQADMVIVTDTLCWLVLDTSDSYCSEDKATIEVRQCSGGRWSHSSNSTKPVETLHDYLDAGQMFQHGLVSAAQHDALLQIEATAAQEKKKREADALRAQLAELEGGAA